MMGESTMMGQLGLLPSSFTGGPMYMYEKTQDAMCYVRKYGRPDLFITFTCNQNWIEIVCELHSNQRPHDQLDLIARVFHLKLGKFMNLIYKKNILGKVQCHIYSIEWQKLGLLHAHILIWLVEKVTPDQIDKFAST